MDIAKGNVSHISSSAGIGLDPSGVAAIVELDVLEDDVLDVVWLVGVASYAADAHPSGPVAGDVLTWTSELLPLTENTILFDDEFRLVGP